MNKKLIIALCLVAAVLAVTPTAPPTAITADLCNEASSTAAIAVNVGYDTASRQYILVNNVCTPCPALCKCTTAGTCLSCLNPRDIFVPANDKAYPATAAKCYTPIGDAKVTMMSTGCEIPCVEAGTAANICSKCSASYYNKAGTCTTCGTNCASCTAPATATGTPVCLTCTAGFYVKDGTCASACTFADTNCGACAADGKTCTACKGDFVLVGTACVACGFSKGAKTCDGADKITACRDGYFFTAAAGTVAATCTACDTNCRLCTATKQCTACNKGSVARDDWVGLYWDAATTACKACTSATNTVYCNTSGDSVVCAPGYVALNKQCMAVITGCTAHALDASSKIICTACPTGQYYNGVTNTCVEYKNFDKCTTAPVNAATNGGAITGCTACSTGYANPAAAVGLGCWPIDPNAGGAVLDTNYINTATVTVGTVTYLQSKICATGYMLGTDKFCYDKSPYSSTNAPTADTVGLKCAKDGAGAACTTGLEGCATGKYLALDGKTCITTCPEGSAVDTTSKTCSVCASNCTECPITSPYYVKSDKTCVPITANNDLGTFTHCKTYAKTGGCTDCTKVGAGLALLVASDATFAWPHCVACNDATLTTALGAGCKTCSSVTVCTACDSTGDYTLQGAKCLAADSNCSKIVSNICVACKIGTYYDATAGTCSKTCDATAGCTVTSGKNCDLTAVVGGGGSTTTTAGAKSGSLLTFAFSAIVLVLAALF